MAVQKTRARAPKKPRPKSKVLEEAALAPSPDPLLRKLTTKELAYVENIGLGMTKRQAAKAAGYTDPASEFARVEANPAVQLAIAEIQAETRELYSVTREKVVRMAFEAWEMAKLTTDPNAMVRVIQELNRMHGHYAPEKKELVLNAKSRKILADLGTMSEQELLEKIGGAQGLIIDGEYKDVTEAEEDAR